MLNKNSLIATAETFAPVIGRLLIASMFVMAGFDKISAFAGTQGWMESLGVPGFLLYPVIALEILGGIAVIVGFQTRLVAFALAGFTIIAAYLFHYSPADQVQMLMFSKNIAIAGGFLCLVAFGAGPLSIDARKQA